MGWSKGSEVFVPVAKAVLGHLASGAMQSLVAVDILRKVGDGLNDLDWDAVDEALDELRDTPGFVVAVQALRAAGLLDCVADDDDIEHDDCGEYGTCRE